MTDYSGQYGLPESPSISSVSSTSPTSPVSPSSNASSLSPASSGSTTSTGSSHCQREIISISSRSIISISSTDAREAAYFNVATTPALLSNSTGSQLVGLGLSGVMMPGSHARSLSPVARRKRSFDEFDDEDEDDFERRPSPRSVRPRLGQSPTTCSRELSPTHVAQQQRQPQNRRSAAIVYIDLTQSDSESYCSSPSSYSDVELPPLQLPG
ncbi:hypothetical protein BC831DRAFT_449242 [Entophlyctis helioformis]|nr:hypothetical protein BC831DRAFT_449242 [Entophlyctis helioformis]